ALGRRHELHAGAGRRARPARGAERVGTQAARCLARLSVGMRQLPTRFEPGSAILQTVSARLRVLVFAVLAVALITPAAYGLATAQTPASLNGGKTLYRKYCGQCHSLLEAKAVGFGTANNSKGGDLGGPSFNPLRVTAQQSKLAIMGVWDGH